MRYRSLLFFLILVLSFSFGHPAWSQEVGTKPDTKEVKAKKAKPKESAVTIDKQKVTSATKANVLLPANSLVGLFPEDMGPVSLGFTTKPESLGADCQPYSCKPTAANNCCDYVKQCNPILHCSNTDWEAYGYDPAPYCKKCSVSSTGNSTICWCSETPVAGTSLATPPKQPPPPPPKPGPGTVTVPPREPQ